MSDNPQTTPDIYSAGDYAGMRVANLEFYYGYEFGRQEDGSELWGFRAKKNGKTVMGYSQAPNGEDPIYWLFEGIGRYLA